ncbi:MAG: Wzz/FepE/Etk N-terminal domain-containing protein [Bacilli bacterium]|nr:Wzz/FepE/Etk N-terminal domain-containing protein [Bacilli bacterium]
MEEINLKDLFNYYVKRIPIIIIVTTIALIIGLIYSTKIQVPMYHGTTTIILVQKQSDKDTSYAYQNELNINEKLVATYSQIIKSRRVLEQVINNLKLETTPKELAEDINVTAVTDTSIIKVSVSNKDNKEAVMIANGVADVFKKEISNIYNLENVSIVDNAVIEDKPYNVNILKELLIAGLAGIVLSCGVLFIIYYFDNTIKTKTDIEEMVGLAVLAEIPTAKKLVKNNRGDK